MYVCACVLMCVREILCVCLFVRLQVNMARVHGLTCVVMMRTKSTARCAHLSIFFQVLYMRHAY